MRYRRRVAHTGSVRPRAVLASLAAAAALAAGGHAAVAATASPVTCADWLRMPGEARTAYVHGMVEGVTVTAVLTSAALLPQLPPAEQLEAAEEVAQAIVADASAEAYVGAVTAICGDPALPREAPVASVFLAAGERLRPRGPGVTLAPPPGGRVPAAEEVARRPVIQEHRGGSVPPGTRGASPTAR